MDPSGAGLPRWKGPLCSQSPEPRTTCGYWALEIWPGWWRSWVLGLIVRAHVAPDCHPGLQASVSWLCWPLPLFCQSSVVCWTMATHLSIHYSQKEKTVHWASELLALPLKKQPKWTTLSTKMQPHTTVILSTSSEAMWSWPVLSSAIYLVAFHNQPTLSLFVLQKSKKKVK